MKTIDRFVGEHEFLNNFYAASLWIDGKRYPTCEHAYQAHKTLDEAVREKIRCVATPREAKTLGHTFALREDWESVRIDLMRGFLQKKFESPFLRDQLLSTGDSRLVYGNTWNDKFWGVCRGQGENWLGKLLEELRESLRTEDT
jgi:N-glycosidase YbiA